MNPADIPAANESALAGQFKADVLDEMESARSEAPHLYGAPFDPAKFAHVARSLDAITQKLAPVISALTPAQYSLYVSSIAAALHAIVGSIPGD